MLKPVLSVFALGAGLALVAACASSSDSSGGAAAGGDEEDITSIRACGGIAGLTCSDGEDCVIASKDLKTPDAMGKCRKPTGRGGEGQACGGIAGIPCGSGLECAGPTSGGLDAPGKCQKASTPKEGQTCGGFAGIPCPSGLDCVLPTTNGKVIADVAGHCAAPSPDEGGQACGGLAGLACPKGLTCAATLGPSGKPIFDAPGHCTK